MVALDAEEQQTLQMQTLFLGQYSTEGFIVLIDYIYHQHWIDIHIKGAKFSL